VRVDVVLCTYNSNKPYFERCLRSVKREVPVNKLIVVDKFSEDGTLEVVRKIFPNALILRSRVNLAKARELGISKVSTEYFVFVDDDIELPRGWFNTLLKYLDEGTGGIHGHAVPACDPLEKWFHWVKEVWEPRRLGGREVITVTDNPDVIRGCTHNTLIKTEAVRDWKPPAMLSAFEDHHIARHVIKKGYSWKVVNTLTVKHYGVSSLRDCLRKAKWNSAGARLIKYDDWKAISLIRRTVLHTVKSLIAARSLRDFRIPVYVSLTQVAYLIGYLRWDKYLTLKR